MRSEKLSRQHQKIRDLLKTVDELPLEQDGLRSHMARYVCVLSAGLIENSLKEVLSDYATKRSHPAVAAYTTHSLGTLRNPKAEKFLETTRRFSNDWRSDLLDFMNQEGRKEAIDSIMANRNDIAHGRDVGITIVRIRDYLSKSVQVIEFMEVLCADE